MSRRLTRSDGRPKAPVRIVHLGLGNFFRAHTCWYTERADDSQNWGIAAFSGRTDTHVAALRAQDELYTLFIQGIEPSAHVISALSAVHAANELAAWRGYFASPDVTVVTSTITEGGYLRDASGDLDIAHPAIRGDIRALTTDPEHGVVTTAPGKFVAGLLARRSASIGKITFVPCDNIVGSGEMIGRVIGHMAGAIDPSLSSWMGENVHVISTMVDRITPRPESSDLAAVERATGVTDPAAVITEPFAQWVLEGEFAGPRPQWETAGATFVDDIVPFEHCKLWLLNGAHSLMAYCGPLRGHDTVQQAIVDPIIRDWVEEWWDEASPHLPLSEVEIRDYRAALIERFTNPAMRDPLNRIAADGSQKLPIRLLSVVRADLEAGRDASGGLRAVSAWVLHLLGGVVNDARENEVLALAEGTFDETIDKVLRFLGLPTDLHSQVSLLTAVLTGGVHG